MLSAGWALSCRRRCPRVGGRLVRGLSVRMHAAVLVSEPVHTQTPLQGATTTPSSIGMIPSFQGATWSASPRDHALTGKKVGGPIARWVVGAIPLGPPRHTLCRPSCACPHARSAKCGVSLPPIIIFADLVIPSLHGPKFYEFSPLAGRPTKPRDRLAVFKGRMLVRGVPRTGRILMWRDARGACWAVAQWPHARATYSPSIPSPCSSMSRRTPGASGSEWRRRRGARTGLASTTS